MDLDYYLPIVFMGLLGFALTAYVLLDGFDIGVGMLLPRATAEEQNLMVDSIGPFWDANETWIVLGVGVLFIVFPKANGLILGELYIPVTLMLLCLMIRGAAYEFRTKAANRGAWNWAFILGSFGMALTQGYMLGRYITAFEESLLAYLFSFGIMLSVPTVYVLLATCWLLAKVDGELQEKVMDWANLAWWPVCICLLLISLATPLVSAMVYERWFTSHLVEYLWPIPLITVICLLQAKQLLRKPQTLTEKTWHPFIYVVMSLVFCAVGLGISLFPYVVIKVLTVWEAAASTEALVVTLIGVAITVPVIIAYSIFAFWVFRGKTKRLNYI